jgi:hypothetical protein
MEGKMSDTAPWLDYQQPAAAPAPAPAPTNANAPWLDYQQPANVSQPTPGYGERISAAASQFANRPYDPQQFGEGVAGAATDALKGILAPIVAGITSAGQTVAHDVTQFIPGISTVPKPTANSWVETENKVRGQSSNNVVAQDIEHLAGTVMGPLADAVHYVSRQVSNNTDKQQITDDLLNTAIGGVTGKVLRGKEAVQDLSSTADAGTGYSGSGPMPKTADPVELNARFQAEYASRLNQQAQSIGVDLTRAQLQHAAGGVDAPRRLEGDISSRPGGQKLADIYKEQQEAIAKGLQNIIDNSQMNDLPEIRKLVDAYYDPNHPSGFIRSQDLDAAIEASDTSGLGRAYQAKLNKIQEAAQAAEPIYSTHNGPPKGPSDTTKRVLSVGGAVLGGITGAHTGGIGSGLFETGVGAVIGHEIPTVLESPINKVRARQFMSTDVPAPAPGKGRITLGDARQFAQSRGLPTDEAIARLLKAGYQFK